MIPLFRLCSYMQCETPQQQPEITTERLPLLAYLRTLFLSHFSVGHARTIKAKKNIVALFLLRGVSVAVNFVLVPLTLSYLNPSRYGIWLTLTSVVGSINLLDIGLGNGLRNKFAEAIAKGQTELARIYVSTTYIFVGIVVLGALLVFWILNPFLPWSTILNVSTVMDSELSTLAVIVFTFFSMKLVFGLIATILIADQQPAKSSFLEIISNVLSLVGVLVLTKTSSGSLILLGLLISFSTAIVPFIANFWFFKRKYRQYSPSISFVRVEHGKELIQLGVQFFILQIAGILIYSSSNIVIAQLFGPTEVTFYNIAYKYYGAAMMGFSILLTPLWSAYTEAFVRGDIGWVSMTVKKLKIAWLILCLVVFLMTFASNYVYRWWVGESVQIPMMLSAFVGIWILIYTWCSIYMNFINGTGKIRLSLWISVIVAVLDIPLAIFLGYALGIKSTGVVIADCLLFVPGCILMPIQMKKLLSGNATGIWAN